MWRWLGNWWPLVAALAVAVCAITMLPRIAPPAATPLALSVDTSQEAWVVSWNPGATAIRRARSARLYVMSERSNRTVKLTADDLAKGQYRHPDVSDDATFRLEVDERTGHVSAESFRLVHR